jgi:tetratricopeptide (TPR) repeat protein
VVRKVALRDEESAAGLLLRRAGDARQKGEADEAIGLYRKLQHDFRGSPEAILSTVPLGGLLLERRLPRAALGQYDLYLSSSHGGLLIPEALYGRGRALAALGDRQEEERNWKRLLGDFPNSAYAPLAQRRLAELR